MQPNISRSVALYLDSYTHILHYTTLLVFKRFFSGLDIFVVVSADIRAAPIVGAAV